MKIGIDARLINETGVGRYIKNLISQLGIFDKENTYVLFLKQDSFDTFVLPNSRWQKRLAHVPWHSVTEQFIMPWLFIREHLELAHIPYFNVPIFYPGKFVVTIHDLTILHFDTGKASTLPVFLYTLRRLGYFLALAVGLQRATNIFAVSQATKQEIVDHFRMNPNKIVVTYEGVGEKVSAKGGPASGWKSLKRIIENPYFLYVGNAYPHKNLEMLVRAFQQFKIQNSKFKISLVLVGKDDFFYQRLRQTVENLKLTDSVIFYGPATDGQLGNLYRHAKALVFPSLMEGFGLPGLEALALGCPVVCSDIVSFREVYKDVPSYFNSANEERLASVLRDAVSKPPSLDWKKKATLLVQQYHWSTMAKETLFIYNQTQL